MVQAGSGARRDRSMNTEDKHQAGLTPTGGVRQQHTVTGRESPCTGEHTSTAAMATTCAADMQQGSRERSSTQADTQGGWYLTSQPHLPGSWTCSPAPACLAGGRPEAGSCAKGSLSPSSPSLPLPTSTDSLGSHQWRAKAPQSHAEQRGAARPSMWTARGVGWACSLTQPALGTTAQLDRAATCRWAGESNEREC